MHNYRWCTSPNIYCSYDCLALLVLSNNDGYLDRKDDIKRFKSEYNLMLFDDEHEYDNIFCSICSTMHSEKDRKSVEAVEDYEKQ